MKILKDILYKISLTSTMGDMERAVDSIVFDSRQVVRDSAFVAIAGTQVDGHEYIATAIEKGASVIIGEKLPESLLPGVTYVQVARRKLWESWLPIFSTILQKRSKW
jgi:UDP-N-acetylmuramoyl-L-alanyl-D-glutamate--2,6-diaminopimelate ligase